MTDRQREVLRALIRSQGHLGPALTAALEELDLARWDELPDAALPWERISAAAEAQGISEADAVWDVCGRLDEPAAFRPLP